MNKNEFINWAKRYIKIPSKEEALNILKNQDIDELRDDFLNLKKVFNKKAMKWSKLSNVILFVASLFVLSSNISLADITNLNTLKKIKETIIKKEESQTILYFDPDTIFDK